MVFASVVKTCMNAPCVGVVAQQQFWWHRHAVGFCRPLKATAGWKPLLQRLQLLGALLPTVGIARSHSQQPGFSLEGLVRIVTVALGNSNAEVCYCGKFVPSPYTYIVGSTAPETSFALYTPDSACSIVGLSSIPNKAQVSIPKAYCGGLQQQATCWQM